jgi:DNA-binding CsgD family transcriptional regulator/tetratricopeptide (TPR) repeat protein
LPEQPLLARPDLFERDAELAAVDGLIRAAPGGGGLLSIEGPPGIGKTSLMVEARARGQAAGMQVVSARGTEFERTFSYGVVRQLFEPLLARLSAGERAELFAGAAALAAPLFDPARFATEPAGDASLAVLHGLYWLTANAAARRPLLLAVDDLQWGDLPSLRWLAYLLPRMEGLGLVIVAGRRAGEPGEDPALLGQILSDPLTIVVRPAPLTAAAAARLVRGPLSTDADDAFCAACHRETGGNPLLLHELVLAVAAEGLATTAVDVTLLRTLGARAGRRAVAVRLSRLPPEATRLATAVAILGDDADPRQAVMLAGLDERAAVESAGALVRVDVLRPQPPFEFVHPLIRAAVYEALTAVERAAGHARAARLLEAAGADPERVAAHLLVTPPSADPGVVATLREAARRAGSRGASESAVAYLHRALAEPPRAAERADLLIELGSSEVRVSGNAAIEHLREAHALLDDPIRRAETTHLLAGQLQLFGDDQTDAVLEQALAELAGAAPELERVLEAALIVNVIFEPSIYHKAADRLDRLRRRPAGATLGAKMLLALLAYHDARAGAAVADVVSLARRALADGTLVTGDSPAVGFALPAMAFALADLDDAEVAYHDALAAAHRQGSIVKFAVAKGFRGQTLVWHGELAEAEAECREALAACEAWGSPGRISAHLAAFLADALMEQGRLDDAAAALDRAGVGEPLTDSATLLSLRDSRARLRMLRGDLGRGLEEMLEAGRVLAAVGGRNPAVLAWRSHAALALRQLGGEDEARRLVAEELELARAWGAPRALGAALRAAGLVEGGPQGLALLEEAVEVLAGSPARLEHARARTELGAALRRANRRSEARDQLRHAVDLATICGAMPLAARAQSELLATGARPRRIAMSGVTALTASERRVADMAARGPTNREIAQALFVAPRTVEVHLSSVYRKLRIRSRSQLAAALAERTRG